MARAELIDNADNRQAGLALLRLRLFLGHKTGRNRVRALSQSALAALLSVELGWRVTQSAISDWEGGEGVVPFAVPPAGARILSKKLGRYVSVDEFLSAEFKNPWIWAADAA